MWMSTKLKSALVPMAVMAAACVAGGVYLYRTGHASGVAQVTAEWNAQRADIAEAITAEIQRVREREISMSTTMARLSEERMNAYRNIDRLERELADSLRDRPEARTTDPTGVPQGAAPGTVGCTGAGLARPDAVFLGRYAALAARLQSDLNTCRAKYAEVERAVNSP